MLSLISYTGLQFFMPLYTLVNIKVAVRSRIPIKSMFIHTIHIYGFTGPLMSFKCGLCIKKRTTLLKYSTALNFHSVNIN